MKKRLPALLLSLSLCVSLLPAALAEGEADTYAAALAALTQEEGYTVDKLSEIPSATVVLRHRDATAADGVTTYSDYELYLVSQSDSYEEPARRLLLPSTALVGDYAPTDRGPDALALCADGRTLTYTYFFDAPLTDGGTVYHEAGTYTYAVDTVTGELSVNHSGEVPTPPAESGVGGFADVARTDWFAGAVELVRDKGVMIGTSETAFSPQAELTQAECLTLAFRLYDLLRGQEHIIEKAPEDWGKMILTLADGTVFEGYGYQGKGEEQVFSWWRGRNGYEGVCIQVPGWSYEDLEAGAKAQQAWMDAHPEICRTNAPATLTLNGVTYEGTANCWMPVGPYVFQFEPEYEKTTKVNAILHHAVFREAGPDRWWRDTIYTITRRELEDVFDPVAFTDIPASRSFFARLIAAACEGNLEQINLVEAIPDLPRESDGTRPMEDEYRGAVYQLYEAGILTGVDEKGTFSPDATLTRAECATMVARAMDKSQRVHAEPLKKSTYESAVAELRGSWGYRNEQTFEAPDCTIFVYDPGGIMQRSYGAITLIYKPGSQLGAGTVIGLPHARVQYTVVGYPADAMTLSEDGKTFTYTYYRPEDIVGWVEGVNEGEVLEKAGCVTYTVDLPSGAVTERFDPPNYQAALAHVMKKRIITPSEHSEDREVVQTLEAPDCTVVLTKGRFVDKYDDYILSLVYKPGSALGDGTIKRLLLPTTVIASGYWLDPTDRVPDSLEVSADGKTLTYVYRFDEALEDYHDTGTYTYTVDMTTGELSVSHSGK